MIDAPTGDFRVPSNCAALNERENECILDAGHEGDHFDGFQSWPQGDRS